jgi:hypothetical protein
MNDDDDYSDTLGGNSSIVHRRLIDDGGFGEVHEVRTILPRHSKEFRWLTKMMARYITGETLS